MLLATKFMNMIESRNSTSTNRLQCFSGSSLLPTVAQEKWDLVKVICTQDFNTRVKFGLAFITLHTSSGKKADRSLVPEKFQQMIKAEANKKQPESGGTAGGIALAAFGRFKLREESPDSDEEGTKVFARWKQKTEINTGSPRPSSSGTTGTLLRDIKPSDALLKKKESTLQSIHAGTATTRPKPQKYESSDDDQKPASVATARQNRNDESLLYDAEDCKPNEKKLAIKPSTVPERPQRPKENARPPEKADKNGSKLSSSKFSEFLQFTGQTVEPGASRTHVSKVGKSPSTSDKGRQDSSKHVLSRSETNAKRMSSLPIEKESVAVKKRPPSPTTDNSGPSSSSQLIKKIRPSTSEPVCNQEDEPKRLLYKPFGKLLENVVLAISGIQHPERGNIRSKALAMGAKYRPDWDSSCTHLICAYKNTPKYNQVKGKGKIVEKDWIEKCYSLRRKLSWRKFALDTEECEVTDSEDEIIDIAQRPPEDEPVTLTDDDETTTEQEGGGRVEASDSEVQPDERGRMPYDISTDDEAGCNDDQSTGGLDFFKDYIFFIDRGVGAVDTMKLERFIKTYKGTMTKAINDAKFIVTRNKLIVESSCKARLVKPLWIFECHEMECFIPVDRYLL
ncbi:hypothetical protein AND_001615 [Anopheles darlingi]|uniref:BRCT domain-containing protein n=1 Tax=Anopheles darlingi TaxID=43151 RepID=W5JUY9_ANODA|nr:hypothetical protein AND_001615 [Anopheles darlingi]